MKTQTLKARHGSLQFTRENLGFPVPRRMSDQDLNEEAHNTDIDTDNEEDIREEEKEIESPDENERIKDGFEWQDDR